MKRLLRIAVMAPGLLYIWALLPVAFRPQYTGSPFRKSDVTLTVHLDVLGVGAAAANAAVGALPGAPARQIRAACEPSPLLRPIVRPSQHVVVRYMKGTRVVAEKRYDCTAYT